MDIGSTRVRAVVVENDCSGSAPRIVGAGAVPARGIRRGAVTDADDVTDCIARAVDEAESQSGLKVHTAAVGLSGTHLAGVTGRGVVALSARLVRRRDVEYALAQAREAVPRGGEVLHELVQGFTVDMTGPVSDPVGMRGLRLEAEVHFITCAPNTIETITRCTARAGLDTDDIVAQALASAEEGLREEEKQKGAALLDIGGGTTDWAVYSGGRARRIGAVKVGGMHVTRDLAVGLQTGEAAAEELKKACGCGLRRRTASWDTIRVPSRVRGGCPGEVSERLLCRVVEMRVRELLGLIASGMEQVQPPGVVRAVVLTGGCSAMKGLPEVARAVLGVPVRLGRVSGKPGLDGGLSVALYRMRSTRRGRGGGQRAGLMSGAASRVNGWLGELLGQQT